MVNKIGVFIFFLFSISFISAVPGIPHQFYGSVTVNGKSAPDNNIITATIDGDTYMTVTKNGGYGYSQSVFYVEDPDGGRTGNIAFDIGGKPAEGAIFENNGYTNLNFDLTTTCGDKYCLGEETCGNCQLDCGICTNPPIITISSPESKTYDTTNIIPIIVSSDQPLKIWVYSLDGGENIIPFIPNISLTLSNGNYNLRILGINEAFQTGTSEVSFVVDIPVCGDLSCDTGFGETCSNCPNDCGACGGGSSSGGGSSYSSGGGSSGGGGGGAIVKKNTTTNQTVNLISKNQEENNQEDLDLEVSEDQDLLIKKEPKKGFFAGITGGVIGNIGGISSIIVVIFVLVIFIAIIVVLISRRKRRISEGYY